MPESGPLWVVGAPPPHRRGNIFHADGRLPAVMWQPHTYPNRPDLEDGEVLSLLCAGVIGLAETMLNAGVRLPAELQRWSARTTPAEELGVGRPAVLSVDDQRTLAMRWDFDTVTAVAALLPAGYVFALVEGTAPVVWLRSLDVEDPAHGGP